MSGKFDRKSAMRTSLGAEKQKVTDRFAKADAVLAEHPTGLAEPAKPVQETPAVSAQETTVRTVDIALVHDNPYNARTIYEHEAIVSLSASVATQGQLMPALATVHPTIAGEYQLIDGQYRKKALIHAGKNTIDLKLVTVDEAAQLYRLSYIVNEERSAQSALDNALAWEKLLKDGIVKESKDIADLIGVAPSTITKTMSLLNLPPKALERVQEVPKKFGAAVGYEISQIAKHMPEGALLELIEKVIQEDMSSRSLEKLRSKLSTGVERKQKELARAYKIKRADKEIGVIKEWDSGKITVELHIDDLEERGALIQELKNRYDGSASTAAEV